MRLFLFLVGGTGSRVMRPLIMQLAAGITPLNESGLPIATEIVPIVIDPHRSNEDLKRTENLLKWYRHIHRSLYGDGNDNVQGFFSVKISSLKDIVPNSPTLSDTFLFNIDAVGSKTFQEFISYNTLDSANQALCSMMFSKTQLETKMNIGFVGNPNIGSVALNKIKDSEEFRQFASVFQRDDRIFIVSSIFGGTGAAGYPIIVNNIRNARNSNQANRGDLADAKIGALTVLPYFNVQQDENSPISRADFISKTKSALYYYHDNLTGIKHDSNDVQESKINACYYLGDEIPSTPYFNDPGNNGQRNDAHIVEFIGALSILDFLQIPDDQLITSDGKAINPIYKEYGLAYDKKQISLMDLGMQSRLFINKQMIKFHIAYMYITNHLKKDIGHGYTLDKPEITNAFLSTSFYTTITANFYVAYNQWLKELKENQRSFVPFNLNTDNLKDCITDIQPKSGFLKSPLDYKKILSAMNSASQKAVKASRFGTNDVPQKLFCLLNETLDKLIEEKYISVI